MYDLPALVDHVCQETGYDKVSTSSVSLILPLPCLLPKPHNQRKHRANDRSHSLAIPKETASLSFPYHNQWSHPSERNYQSS